MQQPETLTVPTYLLEWFKEVLKIQAAHPSHAALQEIICRLDRIERKDNQIMSALDDLKTAISDIDKATTEQGDVLTQEATTLQTISDEVKALAQANGVPADVVASAQALATRAAAVSASLKAQAEFSKQIATDAANPVPQPVPDPTPA